jgi:hypothetical protein
VSSSELASERFEAGFTMMFLPMGAVNGGKLTKVGLRGRGAPEHGAQ